MTKEQLGELIIASKESLYRVAKSILKNDADCEDAVSEMIVLSFAKRETLRDDRYAKTWITRILIHECYHILKKRKRETAFEEAVGKEQAVSDGYSDLYRCMMQLNFDYRVTMVLFYIEGYSIKEIARMTDVAEGTVKGRLSRGREKLRKIYEKEADFNEKSGLA